MRFGLATMFCLLGLAMAAPAWGAPPPPGLVAAYAFDEGTGSVAVDASGNGHQGAIVGAAWTTGGRYGGALSFNGNNAYVGLGSLGTFYRDSFTLEAWVQKQSGNKNDVAVVGTWNGNGPMLWVDHIATRYHLTLGGSFSSYLDSGVNPTAGVWQHLAATFDGTTARIYIDGTQVASRPVTSSVGTSDTWRIGAYAGVPAGFFDGVIDNVRIYDRALSTAEIQTDLNDPITVAGTSDPTMPANFAVAGRNTTSAWVQWSASTDDVGVTGYRVFRDGTPVATTTQTSYTFTGLTCSTSYELAVEAFDGAGNTSPRAAVTAATSLCGDPVGLVAAYSFDENSGALLNDASGNGNNGTISGATWTSGRHGSALAFNGSNAHVALGGLGTFYGTAFTLQAWVQKNSAQGDAAIVGTWTGAGGPMLWVDHISARYHLTLGSSFAGYLDSTRSPKTGQWQHVAATFDGATARYYLNGTQVASRPVTGSVGSSNVWRIAAYGQSPGGFFDGRIDDVRIYDRALDATEVQLDMGQPVTSIDAPPENPPGTPPDTTPPNVAITQPTGGTVTGPISIAATASDAGGWAAVQFKIDGNNFGVEDRTSPYSVPWDTRGELNGAHTLTAVARDRSGNSATAAAVQVTVSNAGVSTTGLRASYAFDEGVGSAAADSSGNFMTGTVTGSGWSTAGRFGSAVSLDGVSGRVDLPALGTFYGTGFTYEAWVYAQSPKVDVGVLGSWAYSQGGGAMVWVDHIAGNYRLALGGSFANYLDSGRAPTVGKWQHVAATYDGSAARIYVDGVQTATATFTGNVGTGNAWRIGAYGPAPPMGFFDGRLDNVRIYGRALSASEIQTDMASRIQHETTPPTVTSLTPAAGGTDVSVAGTVKATFSEPMQATTLNSSTFTLRDAGNNIVPATVSYDQATRVATLTPQAALAFATVHRATLPAGGAKDLAGNGLASQVTWTFTTEAAPPPVLVVASSARPFGTYLAEILRNEGLNAFTMIDVAFLSPALLSQFSVVVLGDTTLTSAQVSTLTSWVNGGGNLIAMRPDAQLAGLLGLTSAGTTLANSYLQVNTGTPAGAGIVGQTIQFHGTADRYNLNGATAIATLYSSATTATTNPAVSLRSVGASGGQAAAFTYDLARSVVYTRQGNPAWVGQERDATTGIAPNDLFYGARPGDVQPDWIDTNKIGIPQADEQQRLLVNLITVMARDRMPVPRFWYLPRGEKAAIALSGDDHSAEQAPGGTASHFDYFKSLSPAGCVVSAWECVRATSFIYPTSNLTNAQAAAYNAEGFDLGLHPVVASCPTSAISQAELSTYFDTQLSAFQAKYSGLPSPVSNRNHCYYWPEWASTPKVELAHGMRMDANYNHFPESWIGTKPGFLNGGGFPMRFADTNGDQIDVYQENTHLTDDATPPGEVATFVASLLDKAIGATGYYGAFGVLMHTDDPNIHPGADAVIAAALARGVPVISYKQLLQWTDGRNASTIRGLAWTPSGGSGGTFSLTTTVAAGANGLQAMLPMQGPAGTIQAITRAGSPVAYTVQTVKGVQYAIFTAATATFVATYS